MELRNFFKLKGREEISKQAYFKARQNLDPEVFTYLNDNYLNDFYKHPDEVKTWKGSLLITTMPGYLLLKASFGLRRRFLFNNREKKC